MLEERNMKPPAISSIPAIFLLLQIVFSSFSIISSAEIMADGVSREYFSMEGDLALAVQVSDLHLSAYYPQRAEDLGRLLAPAIGVIRPDLLLLTGDITDAKNKKRTSTGQDESEWILYKKMLDTLVKESGLEKRRIFDIRGNHDKFGVPYVGSVLDFFSIYSVSSQLHRLGTIQSISLVGDDQTYLFLGIDDTMPVGIRGPSNILGHPTGDRIRTVENELQQWDNHPFVTKIVFGHFPMSFTTSAEKGERYEPVFARQSISAYLCGHLHVKFGKQLWKLHTSKMNTVMKQFWEWELGDWKESRLIRILTIDRGDICFMDIELPSIIESPGDFKTVILITYPMDSRSNNRVQEHVQLVRNDINALVFSIQPILNVTAKVLDSSRDYKIVEEMPLQPTNSPNGKPLYHVKWNAENYISASASRYWLQVLVIDAQGKQTTSIPRPFSVEGKRAKYSLSWLAFFIFDLQWEKVCHILQLSSISFLILLLCLPKLLNLYMERNSLYQKWATSVCISSSTSQRKFVFRLLWFLIEGSRIKGLWYAMVSYLIYLLTMPWFWGHATSEKGKIFKLYFSGWAIQLPDGGPKSQWQGNPDIMTITLPFMNSVVAPLFILIYSFSAERSAACFHSSKSPVCSEMQALSDSENNKTSLKAYNCPFRSPRCKICAGWLRKALLLASAAISCIHLKFTLGIIRAYGSAPVVLSPAISWVPSLFLVATIYSTMRKA